MDYVEAFQNLRTNNKWGRKSPHKAVLMLSIIELFEKNVLSENEIYYDDTLKSTFLKMWNRVFPNDPLFQSDAYLPFWYLQSDSFWHIVPVSGKEDILSLIRDSAIKPSESKLEDCVRYVELDEDLYFLMTLPSGRSSMKRVLLETYTNLSEKQVDQMAERVDNAIDYSVSALSDYEKILMTEKTKESVMIDAGSELARQFYRLNEDLQIELNIQYFSFLKKHRGEREMFKEICPSVFELLDKIINHPVKQNEVSLSFAFTYENFLSDLKISLMCEEESMDLIAKIEEAIDVLRGNNKIEERFDIFKKGETIIPVSQEKPQPYNTKPLYEEKVIEQKHSDDTHEYIANIIASNSIANSDKSLNAESRKGKPWTKEEEDVITLYFNQGRDITTIANLLGRTEVAIKSRLGKLGLIEYTFGQDEQSLDVDKVINKITNENDFTIENTAASCTIKNKNGVRIFSSEGKLKYINGRLYRLNFKRECFTLKDMHFNGEVWIRGNKKIVAYPKTDLYKVMEYSIHYLDDVEDIVDNPIFENCKLRVKGVWYNYNGDSSSNVNKTFSDEPKPNTDRLRIIKAPLYAVRRQAILRAMSFFRLPVTIKDIVKTISRKTWGSTINEEDVEDIIKTISDVEAIDGEYILRKRH